MLRLTEDNLTLLLLLENSFQINYDYLPHALTPINSDLQRVRKRNLCHGIFPVSFFKWVFCKHREDSWVSKFSTLCIVVLHKMWIEKFSMLHESKCITRRIEDHKTPHYNVREEFDSHDILPSNLKMNRDNVDYMKSKILRIFSHECYAIAQDVE